MEMRLPPPSPSPPPSPLQMASHLLQTAAPFLTAAGVLSMPQTQAPVACRRGTKEDRHATRSAALCASAASRRRSFEEVSQPVSAPASERTETAYAPPPCGQASAARARMLARLSKYHIARVGADSRARKVRAMAYLSHLEG